MIWSNLYFFIYEGLFAGTVLIDQQSKAINEPWAKWVTNFHLLSLFNSARCTDHMNEGIFNNLKSAFCSCFNNMLNKIKFRVNVHSMYFFSLFQNTISDLLRGQLVIVTDWVLLRQTYTIWQNMIHSYILFTASLISSITCSYPLPSLFDISLFNKSSLSGSESNLKPLVMRVSEREKWEREKLKGGREREMR